MKKLFAAAAAVALLPAVPGSAATIVLNNLNGINSVGARNGFITAANYWGNMLTNNVTLNFNVGFSALGPNVLAQAGSTRADIGLVDAFARLVANRNSGLDNQAVASIAQQIAAGNGIGVNALVTSVDNAGIKLLDNDGSANNTVLWENTAVLKALGVTGLTGPDATITFGTGISYDFDPSNGITAGQTDFVGVAIHEMGHALGFTSGVDIYDVYACPNGPGCGQFDNADFNASSLMRVLDLFRYSGAGQLDWTVNTPSYFSINNGATEYNAEASFSSGSFNGDGWQASHWQAPRVSPTDPRFTCATTNRIGIMNPYLCGGQAGEVENHDLAAMDAIGWNTRVDVLANPNYRVSSGTIFRQFAPVPEPSTWAMLIIGFGVVGGAMRRREKVRVRFA